MTAHDVPDPQSLALARALTRVRETTWELSDVRSELAQVRREKDLEIQLLKTALREVLAKANKERRELGAALNTITGLRDELAGVREQLRLTHIDWQNSLDCNASVLAAHDARVKADTIKEAAAVLHSSDRVWAHRAAVWLVGSYSEVRALGTPTGEGK